MHAIKKVQKKKLYGNSKRFPGFFLTFFMADEFWPVSILILMTATKKSLAWKVVTVSVFKLDF